MPRGRSLPRLLSLVALLFAIGWWASRADAAPNEALEKQMKAELAAIDPALVPIMEAADRAREAKNWDAAAKGYAEVRTRAPAFFHATRRLCGVEAARGRRDEAIALCREALEKKDTPENHAALAVALLGTRGVRGDDAQDAAGHAKRAILDKPDDPEMQRVACRAALATEDQAGLEACSQSILKLEPSDPYGHFFACIAAATSGDVVRADTELERARELGLPPDMVASMRAKIGPRRTKPWFRRTETMVGGAALAIALVIVVVRARRKKPAPEKPAPEKPEAAKPEG